MSLALGEKICDENKDLLIHYTILVEKSSDFIHELYWDTAEVRFHSKAWRP